MTNSATPSALLCQFTLDSPYLEFEANFLKQINRALHQSLEEMPCLPDALGQRVTQLADQVYGIDEMAYYLDDPGSEVEVKHLREAAIMLLVKTIRFIEALPSA